MDNFISLLFLSFVIGIGLFIKNELTGKAHHKYIEKFIITSYGLYLLLTAVFISKSILDGLDTLLFGVQYGLFASMVWRVYKNEDYLVKRLLYYIILIPLRLATNLITGWEDGIIGIIATNAMMHTMLLVVVLAMAIVKKHYLVRDLTKVVLGADLVAVLFLTIDASPSIWRFPLMLIFTILIQVPFAILLRLLYLRYCKGLDVEIKMESLRGFLEELRLPFISHTLDRLTGPEQQRSSNLEKIKHSFYEEQTEERNVADTDDEGDI